ncbi:MAG: hypothetical protein CVT49_14545 [candidate division Zixibacteria bacterium HGW-Zixibacteria-1]|nr:MAG: hypothetical protein CVT49_14545 [candidate division Zixibacteria bacterium HGW-Zixibacteria-1]
MNRRRIPQIIMSILALFVTTIAIQAAVPNTMNYQGRLTNDQGQPVSATVSMTFTICDAETDGNSKWTETHPSVSVVDGLFSVVLGQGDPAAPIMDTVFSSPNRWLEIVVNGEIISPRTKLASSPYTFQSGWILEGNVLYTAGYYTLARKGNIVWDYNGDHTNLGAFACTTGVENGYGIRDCTVGGGTRNVAILQDSWTNGGATVSGGYGNTAIGGYCTVGGGYENTAGSEDIFGELCTVAGGYYNKASGHAAAIGGGQRDTASGYNSTIPGGRLCKASGRYSLAAGRRAKALHDGSWVWADTTDEDFESTDNNQFLIRASGGVGIGTNTPLSPLQIESANNYTWGVGNGWGDFNIGDGTYGLCMGVATSGGGAGGVRIWTAGGSGHIKFGNSANGDHLTILGTGNVGIGTTTPAYKLDVNGDINVSGSYNVKKGGVNFNHPDYVFEPDYTLMSLDDLKTYVFKNKHLPNVISADDVKKNNGFKLDELLIQMLEKLEEQTLYIIQLNEKTDRIEALEAENDELRTQLSQLTSIVETFMAKQEGGGNKLETLVSK